MNTRYFSIGDLIFSITAAVPFDVPKGFLPFCTEKKDHADFSVTLTAMPILPPTGTLLLKNFGRTIYQEDHSLVIYHSIQETPVCRVLISADATQAELQVDTSLLSFAVAFNYLPLGIAFLPHEGLFLHAATVVLDHRAYAFTAPSGTGKSTHADLWQAAFSASLLNGDRLLLRKKHGRFFAYGLPVAGSSNVFKNESYPLAGLALLSQAPQNQALPLSIDALPLLMEQLDLPLFFPQWAEVALTLLSELLNSIPTATMACRPDLAAAQHMKDYFEGVKKG